MPEKGKSKFLAAVLDKLRYEQAYFGWFKRFILFHRKRHPAGMGAEEVTAFLSYLSVHGGVASATQSQALSTFYMR